MFNTEINKVLLWDNETNCLVQKKEVWVQIVGNKDTVFFEEGPLYVENGQEILQAVQLLKDRLIKKNNITS